MSQNAKVHPHHHYWPHDEDGSVHPPTLAELGGNTTAVVALVMVPSALLRISCCRQVKDGALLLVPSEGEAAEGKSEGKGVLMRAADKDKAEGKSKPSSVRKQH